MASATVEDYVKTIYLLSQGNADQLVPMGKLADRMGVVPGTATTMMKALSEAGLIKYEPRSGVRLSPGGHKLALHVLRRHRLIELLLVEKIGLDWSEVHAEAEALEHAVSDRLMERIDELLGYPRVDPHGDPIPTAGGTVEPTGQSNLSDCSVRKKLTVTRVADQDPAFLQFLTQSGLQPGTTLTVQSRDERADAVKIRNEAGKEITLGTRSASKVFVE